RINFNITGKQVPKPESLPRLNPRDLEKIVFFEHEGQEDLDGNAWGQGNTVTDLQDWVAGLRNNKELFDAVGKRYVPIHLYGHASKTDRDLKNYDLSEKRIQNVQRRLKGMLGNDYGQEVWFNPHPIGSREADQRDVSSGQRDRAYLKDRRVEIEINPAEA